MQMSQIRREILTAPESIDFGADLVRDAQDILGYSCIEASKNASVTDDPLSSSLRKLQIETLNPYDVKFYQMERRHEVEREWLDRQRSNDPDRLAGLNRYQWPEWIETEISHYSEPIPFHVLDKAVQIRRELPECKIFIEHLTEHPDPFLLVKSGKYDEKVAYIEVWEEPRFEGRKTR